MTTPQEAVRNMGNMLIDACRQRWCNEDPFSCDPCSDPSHIVRYPPRSIPIWEVKAILARDGYMPKELRERIKKEDSL